MILEYEIMKYGDLGRPNLFVPLSKDLCQDKIGSLLEVFPSQARRQWFNEEAFWSLLRLRGIECNAPYIAVHDGDFEESKQWGSSSATPCC